MTSNKFQPIIKSVLGGTCWECVASISQKRITRHKHAMILNRHTFLRAFIVSGGKETLAKLGMKIVFEVDMFKGKHKKKGDKTVVMRHTWGCV